MEVRSGELLLQVTVPEWVEAEHGYQLTVQAYYQEDADTQIPAQGVALEVDVYGGTAANTTGLTDGNGQFLTIIQHVEPLLLTIKEVDDVIWLCYWEGTEPDGTLDGGFLFEVTIDGGVVSGGSENWIAWDDGLIDVSAMTSPYCYDTGEHVYRIEATKTN